MPQCVIDAFKRQGALWGGDYKGRTDPMHFEFCSRDGAVQPVPPPVKPQPKPEPIDPPHAGGEEGPPPADEPAPVPPPAPARPGFFGRIRNWVVGALSSIGFGGVSALADWKIAALLLGFLLADVSPAVTTPLLLDLQARVATHWLTCRRGLGWP